MTPRQTDAINKNTKIRNSHIITARHKGQYIVFFGNGPNAV
jgi:hypothetical protein